MSDPVEIAKQFLEDEESTPAAKSPQGSSVEAVAHEFLNENAGPPPEDVQAAQRYLGATKLVGSAPDYAISNPAPRTGPEITQAPTSTPPARPLNLSPEEARAQEMNVPLEERAARQLRAGLDDNLTFNAVRAAERFLTGDSPTFSPVDKQGGLLTPLTAFADPFTAKAFEFGRVLGEPLAKASGLAAKGDALKASALIAKSMPFGEDIAKGIETDLFKQKLLEGLLRAPEGFATAEAARSAVSQYADKGNVDLKEVGKDTGKAALLGAILGPGTVGAGKVVAGLWDKTPTIVKDFVTGRAAEAAKSVGIFGAGDADKLDAAMEKTAEQMKLWHSTAPPGATVDAKMNIARELFQRNLEDLGGSLKPEVIGRAGRFRASDFLTKTMLGNYVDSKAGTRLTEAYAGINAASNLEANLGHELFYGLQREREALLKMGLSDQDISRRMVRTIDTPDGPTYLDKLAAGTPEEMRTRLGASTHLEQSRALLTNFFIQHPQMAERVGFIGDAERGYVPVFPKEENLVGTPAQAQTAESRINPSIIKERFNEFDPAFHEDNWGNIIQRYSRLSSRYVAWSDTVPLIQREMMKSSFAGQTRAAQDLAATAAEAMDLAKPSAFEQLLVDNMLGENRPLINEIEARLPNADEKPGQLLNAVKDSLYNAKVFTNAKTLIAHGLQPMSVGAAEIGRYAPLGMKLLLTADSEGQTAAKAFLKRATVLGHGIDTEAGAPAGGIVKKLYDLPAIPARTAMTLMEQKYRKAMFLGARQQMLDSFKKGGSELGLELFGPAGEATIGQELVTKPSPFFAVDPTAMRNAGVDWNAAKIEQYPTKVLDGLTTGERLMVQNAYKQGGMKAAADTYGAVRANRIIFPYTMSDTPNAFRGPVGQLIPFRTWTTNMMMRYLGDVQSGSASQIAKRVAIPIVMNSLFRGVTGYDFDKGNPNSELANYFNMGIASPIKDVVGNVAQGKFSEAGKAAAGYTPWGNLTQQIQRAQKINENQFDGAGYSEKFLGLKKLEEQDKFERALPEALRKLWHLR